MTAVLDALRTADGERLAASVLPGPGTSCVALAHGDRPQKVARWRSRRTGDPA